MLVSSIGRAITLPGIPYDPSICDILASDRPPIAIGYMDLRSSSKLGPVRRPSRPGMGTTVQKVSDSFGYYPGVRRSRSHLLLQ